MNREPRRCLKYNRGMLAMLVMCAYMAAWTTPCIANTPDSTLMKDIVDGITMRATLLENMNVRMHRTIYNVPSPARRHQRAARKIVGRDEFEVHRKAEKVRVRQSYLEPKSGTLRFTNVFAWDGERARGYSEYPVKDRDSSGGIVRAAKGAAYSAGHHLCVVEKRVFELDTTLAKLVQTDGWKAEGSEKIGETSTVVICGPVAPNMRLKAWIAPERGFAPMKMRLETEMPGGERTVQELTDVEVKQVDGVWVPVQATVLTQSPHVDHWQGCEFTMKHIECGVEYPDDLFVLKFPPGKEVFDATTKLVYRANEDGSLEPVFFHGGDRGTNIALEAGDRVADMEAKPYGRPPASSPSVSKADTRVSDEAAGPGGREDRSGSGLSTGIWLCVGALAALTCVYAVVRRHLSAKRRGVRHGEGEA